MMSLLVTSTTLSAGGPATELASKWISQSIYLANCEK